MSEKIYGVGFLGDGKYKSYSNGQIEPAYRKWYGMMYRCYGRKDTDKRRNTYEDCSVCEEWHNYQNFAEWFYKQDWKGNQLDKDESGLRVYGPETCKMMPVLQNSFTLNRGLQSRNTSGSTGINFDKENQKWKASFMFNGHPYYVCMKEDKDEAIRIREYAVSALKSIIDDIGIYNVKKEDVKEIIKDARDSTGSYKQKSVPQAKYNALKKESERLKELLSEDLVAENAKLKLKIWDMECAIPKIKADAIREAVEYSGMQTLNLTGIMYTETDLLFEVADNIEAGK